MHAKSIQDAPVISQAQHKLWKLASNPFSVLGEAQVTDNGITLTCLGDVAPEIKLGLAPGTFPTTVEQCLAMMHQDDIAVFESFIKTSISTGQPFDANYRLADGRGGWRWVEGRAVPVDVQSGKFVNWVFTVRDFTTQREAEAALRRSLHELEASRSELRSEREKLWHLAANAFSVLGEAHLTDGGFDFNFFDDGPLEPKVGLAPGTMPQSMEKLLSMMHPDDIEAYQRKIQHCLATGEPFRVLYRLTDGRGGWRWIQARAISIEQRDGKHVRWLHDSVDVTEQKELEAALRQSVEELQELKSRLQTENLILRQETGFHATNADIIGNSPALGRVLEQVNLVAGTTSTVLITGETGTGKELVARAIHQRSDRNKGLFVAVNCAALPETLVESELFGHEKGAFTGALARRSGRFEQADGGTLFLDEIGELPLETQAKMLRVLQSGEFERVGGERPLKTDVRIIAASNRDLEQDAREGLFRSDLYHRLAIFPIHLPPLRERREDIPLLAAYLATRKARRLGRKIDRLPEDVVNRLMNYGWPGNVRELENVLERAIILSPQTTLRLEAIQLGSPRPASPAARKESPGALRNCTEEDLTIASLERSHIVRVCEVAKWKIKGPGGAAERLGLNPATLYSRMKKLGIRRHERRGAWCAGS